jgi:transcription elongation GreA/GreB family factor
MKDTSFLFLRKDYLALEKNIDALKNNLKTVGFEVGEMSHQSSETWHDNYGFEEADRERKRLAGTLEELKKVYAQAEVVEPSSHAEKVSLGSRVMIQNIDTHEEKIVVVGSYMVLEKTDPNEFSYAAPFVAPLMGAAVGEIREVKIGEVLSWIKVIGIRE